MNYLEVNLFKSIYSFIHVTFCRRLNNKWKPRDKARDKIVQ